MENIGFAFMAGIAVGVGVVIGSLWLAILRPDLFNRVTHWE